MTPWTDAARHELETYFARIRPALEASGADADEVIEDLRRHLAAEVATANLSVVTEDDLRRLLARLGAPQPSTAAATPIMLPTAAPAPAPPRPKAGVFLLLGGVVLPLVTLLIEWITGMCAGTFFDPTPTLWHGLLVILVPATNLLVWRAVLRHESRWRGALGWANGLAVGIAVFYSLLFLPLLLPGLVAIVFFGLGLLPWAPTLALVSTLVLRRRLRQLTPDAPLPGLWRGLGLAALALVLIQAPVAITRLGLNGAASDSPEAQRRAIGWLRAIGSEDQLLRACYGQTRGAANFDLLGLLLVGGESVPPEKAREIYFRVTGRPFNSVPAPAVRTARGAFADLNEWTWDADHGGDQVGGRLKGLTIRSSRLDTLIEPAGALSYTEWTLEFKNDSPQDREARAQILLPPGGAVSRLTLWVNGEEREAAFAGRSQTREAYRKIAVQQRRDPVLVTTCGPDRVLMQCFPVPRDGGRMKVRLGITAPLTLDSAAEGVLRLPEFLERNFTLPPAFQHTVWVEAQGTISTAASQLVPETSRPGHTALRGQLPNAELASPRAVIRVPRDPANHFAWTKDTRSADRQFIRQTIAEEPLPKPTKVIFVVDGSLGMAAAQSAVAQAIGQLPPGLPATVVWAADEAVTLTNGTGTLKESLLRQRTCGGQDNVPALLRAWNLALQTPGSAIVWVHGAQPMLLSTVEPLLQAAERTAQPPKLIEFQTEPGPDRLLEQLGGLRGLQSVLRRGNVAEDLSRLVKSFAGGVTQLIFRRERVGAQAEAAADNAVEASLNLARLWAKDQIRRLQSARTPEAAVKLAGLYQLVTPISGAVVLENQQQYAETGLTPVEAQSVPSIPEPGSVRVLFLGLVAWWLLHRRRDGSFPHSKKHSRISEI